MNSSRTISVEDALAQLLESAKERSIALFEHGTLRVKLYAPRGLDSQTPHEQDEIYVVISGTGEFVSEDGRRTIAPHDFIFVRAGIVHRFENFSDDLALWVFFYGPSGGECAKFLGSR